jgi:hypothetical protein
VGFKESARNRSDPSEVWGPEFAYNGAAIFSVLTQMAPFSAPQSSPGG